MMPSRTRRRSARPGLTALLGTTFTLACAATLPAQVVSDPRLVEFVPSPAHWTMLDSGQPAVSRYDLEVFLVGASTPFHTVDMGKPSPEADGKIRYDFSSQVAAWPLPGGDYEARVSAVGPEGAGRSTPSNPFTFSTASTCTAALSATTVSASAAGGSYAVDVSTGDGCGWAATTALTWVTISTASGSGSGPVPFTVEANSSSSSRTGTLTIAEQTLTVSQAAPPSTSTCSYKVSPTSASVPAAGGSGSVDVTAGSACAWTVVSSQNWVVPAVTGGTGSAKVGFTVKSNNQTTSRTATLTIATKVFSVTQGAKVKPGRPR